MCREPTLNPWLVNNYNLNPVWHYIYHPCHFHNYCSDGPKSEHSVILSDRNVWKLILSL